MLYLFLSTEMLNPWAEYPGVLCRFMVSILSNFLQDWMESFDPPPWDSLDVSCFWFPSRLGGSPLSLSVRFILPYGKAGSKLSWQPETKTDYFFQARHSLLSLTWTDSTFSILRHLSLGSFQSEWPTSSCLLATLRNNFIGYSGSKKQQ